LLYLQQFKFTITHIAGKDNRADALSRLPIAEVTHGTSSETEAYAYSVASAAVPAALDPKRVEIASENDPMLSLVREAITSGDWAKLQGTPYKAVKDELWVLGQLVLRGERLVMPEATWEQTLKLVHAGHRGMVRMKARLREKVWWPSIDKQVEDFVKSCHPCQLVGPRPRPEPIRTTKLPEGPWQEIAVDLLDISQGNHLLVVVDYYSRWPEVVLLKKTDAHNVIKCMEAMFHRHGLPETVRSDNGPPFASVEFEAF